MSEFTFVLPSDIQPKPTGDNYEFFLEDYNILSNSNSVDTEYNPLILSSLIPNLHSLLQNDFYTPLFEVVLKEIQQFMEKAYKLEVYNNIDIYLGDQEEFLTKCNNLITYLNIQPLNGIYNYLLTNYYNEDFSEVASPDNLLYLRNKWLRDYIKSSHVTRKWFSSFIGYRYILNSIYKNGSVSLRSKYGESQVFDTNINRIFKLTEFFGTQEIRLENSTFSKLLPSETEETSWPRSRGVRGLSDYYYLSSTIYTRYDTDRRYDDGIIDGVITDNVIRYDKGTAAELSSKGLILDIDVDMVLRHTNSIGTDECLMDNIFLDYLDNMLPAVKKVTENFMIGAELNLVASNSGHYVDNPALQKIVVDGEDIFYTHPNIKAKFQVYPVQWGENSEISYIKIGEGNWEAEGSNVFADHTELTSSLEVPTDIQKPLMSTLVGQYELNELNNYITVSSLFYKNSFLDKTLPATRILIAQTQITDANVGITTINLPHKFITPGSCSFEMNIDFEEEDTSRKLVITESYNVEYLQYITSFFLYDDQNNVITFNTLDKPADFTEDRDFSVDYEIMPSKENDMISLLPIEVIGNKVPVYCKIDHYNGTIKLKLRANPASPLGINTAYNGTGAAVEKLIDVSCSYTTNSIKRTSAEASSSIASFARATEVGLFNSSNTLVAYGVFPPVIYDTDKYHMSINCLLEKPALA